ncbi:hypothetical protein RB195_012749 [Necator americanus]|uniref:Nucleoporin Nup133/Nup155-like N-terminal domain-containing protein n=1 Tax=Necator americanus TaxID=51031 RepID=A0ABR1DSD1_NECAM
MLLLRSLRVDILKMNAADELELVLDRISSEYPALVMETLQSVGIDEIPDDCTALADGFCWMVSKHSVFVWSVAAEGDSHQRAVQLPLPPSGLPYSAKSVVVYKNEFSDLPGVLVISGEGVARHFPSLTSSVNDETAIDLASEVTLSVQFLKSSRRESSFVLTTTSGSVYLLHTSTHGEIQWTKIGSRESRGIGKRLSNIIFGSQAMPHESSRVVTSLIYQGNSEDDCSSNGPFVVTVSPSTINTFDLSNKSAPKTNIRSELKQRVACFYERAARGRPVAGVNIWFLDAAVFRSGILLLLAGTHDNTTEVTFFLAVSHFDHDDPSKVEWFSTLTIDRRWTFEAADESSFIGHVFLCVPGKTSNSFTCEPTGGVFILYPNFVQSVLLPDELDRCYEPLLNKVVPFSSVTKLIGHACDERFCYVMSFDGAIYCVRLLPKGFEDDLSDDKVFMDDLCNLKDSFSQDDGQLFLFASAFTLFATKNIVEACELMKPLLRKPDNDLVVLVYIFLKHVLDQPVGSQPEKGLNTKKIVCNRTILFLKHMNVYDKVLSIKVLISSLSSSRTGSSILLEMIERVAVAIALSNWEGIREDRAEIMEQVTKRLHRISDASLDCESAVYSKLSLIHNLPAACVETMRELIKRTADKEAKELLIHLCADLLLTFVNAVETNRRHQGVSIIVSGSPVQFCSRVIIP